MSIKGLRPVDLALFLDEEDTLVLGDIHIGFEEAMQKQGVFLPKFHYQDLFERLQKILTTVKPKKVVINGDIKHEFGTISEEEWRNTLKLIDFLKDKYELVLIKGNHDQTVEPIAKKRGLKLEKSKIIGKTYIYHGDSLPKKEDLKGCENIIISHDHPAISLKEGSRIEKYKCFLMGEWEGIKLAVLPAFSPTASGSDILKERMMSPLLKNIKDFEVIVSEGGKLYRFGKVKDLK